MQYLIPLGVYQGTAFMAEYGIGLLCSGLIRTFMTTALLAISLPTRPPARALYRGQRRPDL